MLYRMSQRAYEAISKGGYKDPEKWLNESEVLEYLNRTRGMLGVITRVVTE